ncbi:hypothetical protein ACLOJK_006323 [Asimina triloba]
MRRKKKKLGLLSPLVGRQKQKKKRGLFSPLAEWQNQGDEEGGKKMGLFSHLAGWSKREDAGVIAIEDKDGFRRRRWRKVGLNRDAGWNDSGHCVLMTTSKTEERRLTTIPTGEREIGVRRCERSPFARTMGEGEDWSLEAVSELRTLDGSILNRFCDGKTTPNGFNDVKDESQNVGNLNGGSSSIAVDSEAKPSDGYFINLQDVQSACTHQDSNGAISPVSLQSTVKVEGEGTDVQDKGSLELPPSPVKHGKLSCGIHSPLNLGTSPVSTPENLQAHDMSGKSPSLGECKDAEGETEGLSCGNKDTITDRLVSTSSEPNQCGQESVDLLGHTAVQEGSSKSRHGSKSSEESSKVGCVSSSPPAPSYRRLVVGFVGKSSSASSMVVLSKTSVSTSHKSVSTVSPEAVKTSHFSKQRVKVKSSTDWKKENPDAPKDEKNKQDVSQPPVKDRPKSPASGLKTSQTSRISFGTSKHSTSDAKEQVVALPSKASLMQGTPISTGSIEHPVQSHAQGAPQGKHSASGSSQKSEKINASSSYPSSKLFNHATSMHPPAPVNSSAALSDEELALLLHQELNSSPRVPRVPRVRHAGSMPQLASPSATSMLAKRPSTSGGKDHVLVSRRKPKEETSKDNTRNSREQADESKKMSRLPPSPDNRRQDPNFTTDGPSKKDFQNRSPEAATSAKKTMQGASSTVLNVASSVEANEQNLAAIRSSPKATSDDDSSGVTRTLPGLIAEIMSKGKRMTYEALCNAVRPHWNNLRKHNGERYAYSTHSQAVLDCLRNRSEWAQLIDRGPKTNSSRKRRKLDPDRIVESENEDTKDRPAKHVEGRSVKSQQDDVPKGKRKARKRRRLTLQGRGLKEVRKRQKAEAVDDDFGLYSSEGTESIFSEDESHGGRTAAIGSDTSTSSSDENGI